MALDSRLRIIIGSSVANLASPLTTLVTGPLLARALGPDGRGFAAALFAPVALASLMFTLGVPEALTYFVASGRLAGRKARRVALMGGLVCSAASFVALYLAAPYLFRNQRQCLPIFNLLLLTLPWTLVFSAFRGIAQGRQKFRCINQERISSALLRLLALLLLVGMHALTPVDSVWVTLLAGAAGCLFLLPALSYQPPEPVGQQDVETIARYAGSVALGTFGGLLVIRLDQVLMVSLTTRAELAYYAVAASLAELPLAIAGACGDLAFSLAAQKNDPNVIARSCRLTLLAVGVICLTGAVITPFILPVLFGERFAPATTMAEILFLGTVCRAVTAVIGAGLMTLGRTWIRSGIQLGGAALTALLIFAFVPTLGGIGAAIVTTLTFASLAIASTFVYLRASGLSLKQCIVPTHSDLSDLLLAAKGLLSASKNKSWLIPGNPV